MKPHWLHSQHSQPPDPARKTFWDGHLWHCTSVDLIPPFGEILPGLLIKFGIPIQDPGTDLPSGEWDCTYCTCWLVATDLTTCTRCELYYCCLLSSRYTLALSRIMLLSLFGEVNLLPSGRRFRLPRSRTGLNWSCQRFLHSYVAIRNQIHSFINFCCQWPL